MFTELEHEIYIQKSSKVNSCARMPRLLHSGVSKKKKVYGGRAKTSVQIKTKSYYIWSLNIGCKGGNTAAGQVPPSKIHSFCSLLD